MKEEKSIPLLSNPYEFERWLVRRRKNKYPGDESGVWSTSGRVSYNSPKHGTIAFEVDDPTPEKLLILSVEYERTNQSQEYVNDLINDMVKEFGDLSLPAGFSIVVSDKNMVKLLEERWGESLKTRKIEAYLATMILLGSILEGMLLDIAKSNPEKANKSTCAPRYKDEETGEILARPFRKWGLSDLINVSRECGWLSNHNFYNTESVRQYRNLVHPNAQLEADLFPDDTMCDIARVVVEAALKDLKRYAKDGEEPRG